MRARSVMEITLTDFMRGGGRASSPLGAAPGRHTANRNARPAREVRQRAVHTRVSPKKVSILFEVFLFEHRASLRPRSNRHDGNDDTPFITN